MKNESKEIVYVRIEDIIPNRFQPRIAFDENELNNLADSIMKYGIIQPLVVRPISDKYEIIAGERRYKASVIAGLKTVPVIIKTTDDNTSAEIALLENLQRKNLTPIEEAMSYKKLINKGFTQEEIASKLGISQSSIANKLRLLNLPQEVQDALLYNKISERHARSLLALSNSDEQKELLNKIINNKLTVKQTELEINSIINEKNKVLQANEENNFEEPKQNEPKIIEENQSQIEKEMEEIRKMLEKDLNNFESTQTEQKSPEILEFDSKQEIPDVISIKDDSEDKTEMNASSVESPKKETFDIEYKDLDATPFVGKHLENTYDDKEEIKKEKEEINQAKSSNIEDTILKPSIEDYDLKDLFSENSEKPNKIEEEYKKIDLDKFVSKINELITEFGINKNMISISQIDLLNKHQITIDIKKN